VDGFAYIQQGRSTTLLEKPIFEAALCVLAPKETMMLKTLGATNLSAAGFLNKALICFDKGIKDGC